MTARRHFASDNNAGVHPAVWRAMQAAGEGHVRSYGHDELTGRVEALFREQFGREARAWMVFNGTAANVLGLESLTGPHHAIICAEGAHIAVDECGAPERFTGCKLLTVRAEHGKIAPQDLERFLIRRGDQHFAQPHVVSITQPTELGTVYSLAELRALADFVHAQGLRLECGRSLVIEHNGDVFACGHFVYPRYRLGNIMTETLRAMVAASLRSGFGLAKASALPDCCRECDVLAACRGGCPKHRFTRTFRDEPGLNYLCEGYRKFFRHSRKYLQAIVQLLALDLPPEYVMKAIGQPLVIPASEKTGKKDIVLWIK